MLCWTYPPRKKTVGSEPVPHFSTGYFDKGITQSVAYFGVVIDNKMPAHISLPYLGGVIKTPPAPKSLTPQKESDEGFWEFHPPGWFKTESPPFQLFLVTRERFYKRPKRVTRYISEAFRQVSGPSLFSWFVWRSLQERWRVETTQQRGDRFPSQDVWHPGSSLTRSTFGWVSNAQDNY